MNTRRGQLSTASAQGECRISAPGSRCTGQPWAVWTRAARRGSQSRRGLRGSSRATACPAVSRIGRERGRSPHFDTGVHGPRRSAEARRTRASPGPFPYSILGARVQLLLEREGDVALERREPLVLPRFDRLYLLPPLQHRPLLLPSSPPLRPSYGSSTLTGGGGCTRPLTYASSRSPASMHRSAASNLRAALDADSELG